MATDQSWGYFWFLGGGKCSSPNSSSMGVGIFLIKSREDQRAARASQGGGKGVACKARKKCQGLARRT